MKVDGITLLQKIKSEEIKDNTKIKVYYLNIPTNHILEVTSNNLIWQPGEFMVGELWDKDYTFEILEEKPKQIENWTKFAIDRINVEAENIESLKEYLITTINTQKEIIDGLNFLLKKEDEQ